MYSLGANRLTALTFAAVIASALTFSLTPAYAQKHGGGSAGHGGESSSHSGDDSGGCGGCSGDEGGGGKGGKGGKGGSQHVGEGGRSQSLTDVFHALDAASETEHSGSDAHEGSSMKDGSAGHGKHGDTGSTRSGH